MSKSTFNSITSLSDWSESLVKHLHKTIVLTVWSASVWKADLRRVILLLLPLLSSLGTPTSAPSRHSLMCSNVTAAECVHWSKFTNHRQCINCERQRANDIYSTIGVSQGGAWLCKMEQWKTQSWHHLMDERAKQVRLCFTSCYITVK